MFKLKNQIQVVLLAVFLIFYIGCKKEPIEELEAPSSLAYTTSSLVITAGESVSSDAPTVMGEGTITYSISTVPSTDFIIVNQSTGVLTALEDLEEGEYTITITATNSSGSTSAIFTIIVEGVTAAPSDLVYNPSSVSISFGSSFSSVAPSVSGTQPIYYNMSVVNSEIVIDSLTGIISAATSLVSGVYNLSITAYNTIGNTATIYTLTVDPAVQLISFDSDIKPIMKKYNCSGCHSYGNYSSASSDINKILDRVNRSQGGIGFMPKNGNKLNNQELSLLQQWLDDGLNP